MIITKIIMKMDNIMITSSNNESLLSRVALIQNKKVTKQSRNYTSQSFFIDKNAMNNFNKNNLNKNKNIFYLDVVISILIQFFRQEKLKI